MLPADAKLPEPAAHWNWAAVAALAEIEHCKEGLLPADAKLPEAAAHWNWAALAEPEQEPAEDWDWVAVAALAEAEHCKEGLLPADAKLPEPAQDWDWAVAALAEPERCKEGLLPADAKLPEPAEDWDWAVAALGEPEQVREAHASRAAKPAEPWDLVTWLQEPAAQWNWAAAVHCKDGARKADASRVVEPAERWTGQRQKGGIHRGSGNALATRQSHSGPPRSDDRQRGVGFGSCAVETTQPQASRASQRHPEDPGGRLDGPIQPGRCSEVPHLSALSLSQNAKSQQYLLYQLPDIYHPLAGTATGRHHCPRSVAASSGPRDMDPGKCAPIHYAGMAPTGSTA